MANSLDDAVDALERAIVQSLGRRLPPWACRSLAYGTAYTLMRHCWESATDVIGTEDELRSIVPGMPAELVLALIESGVVQATHAEFTCPWAWPEMPEHVRKKWAKAVRGEDRRQIISRAAKRTAVDPKPPETPTEEPEVLPSTLFGDEPEADQKPKRRASKQSRQPHTQRVIDHWFKLYEEKYHVKPTFTARDAGHVKQALTACDNNPAKVEDAIVAYLACSDQFFRGHPLSLFIGRLNRWVAEGQRHGATGGSATLDESIAPDIL